VQILEAALAEGVGALELTGCEENWPWERTQDRVKKLCDPIEELIKWANSSQRDSALETWVAQVRTIAKDAVWVAKKVLKDQSTNYTVAEIDDKLQVYCDRGQRLSELLVTGWLAGYARHPRFKGAKAAVQGEELPLMKSATEWLYNIKKGLSMSFAS
jgi:hypothetical protein